MTFRSQTDRTTLAKSHAWQKTVDDKTRSPLRMLAETGAMLYVAAGRGRSQSGHSPPANPPPGAATHLRSANAVTVRRRPTGWPAGWPAGWPTGRPGAGTRTG